MLENKKPIGVSCRKRIPYRGFMPKNTRDMTAVRHPERRRRDAGRLLRHKTRGGIRRIEPKHNYWNFSNYKKPGYGADSRVGRESRPGSGPPRLEISGSFG